MTAPTETPTAYLPYRFHFLNTVDQIQNLLVLVAMDSELNAFRRDLPFETVVFGNRTQVSIQRLALPRCQISIAKCGVGLVNAGVTLAWIAEFQKVDAVVFLGVGGALDETLRLGDVVVSKQILQHDSLLLSEQSEIAIAAGELTLSLASDQQVDPVLRCDPTLVRWITSTLAGDDGKVLQGTIVSGSSFVANMSKKQELRHLRDDAFLVDMEAAALAQVARRMQIPFVAAKTVVDTARPTGSIEADYLTSLDAAARHSAVVLDQLLRTFS